MPGRAQSVARPTSRAELDSIARADVDNRQVVGRSVAVVRGRDTLLMASYGIGSLELRTPTPSDAVYEIGSVTKSFTAVAILQLADRGRLDLDAPITRYLPGYPLRGRSITVRRLLDHTSGIKGFTEMPAWNSTKRHHPRDTLVAMVAAEPFTFEPGGAQIYNNSGYFLAGRIIEKVSGRPYEEYVEREIFAPLGMSRSAYCSNSRVHANKVTGYVAARDGFALGGYIDHRWPYAAGSLCSSAGDVMRWLHALHAGRLLSPRSYREMVTPSRLTDGTVLRYGLGVYVGDDPAGHAMIGHGGAIPGYLSETRFYPRDSLFIVVLQNTNSPFAPELVADALAERVLGRRPSSGESRVSDGAAYVGTYRGPSRNDAALAARVERSGDGLVLRVGKDGPIALRKVGVDRFVAAASRSGWPYTPVELSFRRRGDQIAELRLDNGYNHLVLTREVTASPSTSR